MNIGIRVPVGKGQKRFIGKIVNTLQWGMVVYREVGQSGAKLWKMDSYSIDQAGFDWAYKTALVKGLLQFDRETRELTFVPSMVILKSPVSSEGEERAQYRISPQAGQRVGEKPLQTAFTNRVKEMT